MEKYCIQLKNWKKGEYKYYYEIYRLYGMNYD